MKKNRFTTTVLANAALVALLTACALPNLKPFTDATAQIHTAVIMTDNNLGIRLAEAGAQDKANGLREQLSARITAMEALVTYSDALANITDAGKKGSDSAENLSDAIDGFLGAISAPTMPINYVAVAKSVYGVVANVRAAASLADATEAANPAIQSIAAILIKDFGNIKEIVLVAGQELNRNLVDENNDLISYRFGLEKRRRQIEQEIVPGNIDQQKIEDLQELNLLIDMTKDRYEPVARQQKKIEDRTAIQLQILESAKKGVEQWAAIHESLANSLKKGLPPNSRLIATTVIELRELIKKEDEL